jgi:hypothetical protein
MSGEAIHLIERIRRQLSRLGARASDDVASVGEREMIVVGNLGDGEVLLTASRADDNFYWHGPATDVLERLSGLPDGSGAQAVRSEFASRLHSGA